MSSGSPGRPNDSQGARDEGGDDDEDGWQDIEPDVEEQTQAFKSLFEDRWFGNMTDLIKHDKENHGFDYIKLRNQFKLDFMDCVRLVNFVRSEVQQGRGLPETWKTASLFDDDGYLKPTMPDDAVLYSLDDIDESALDSSTPGASRDGRDGHEMQDLRDELAQVKSQFSAYREAMQASFQKQIDSIKDDEDLAAQQNKLGQRDQDSSYFSSYSHPSIHSSMLKDTIRTDAYRDFIYDNKHLFRGKTVLDLGCGTGILSLFCAKAGAKRVLAVDNSAIIDKARVIVYENGLADVISCLRGKIEAVSLPVDKVDVIVSEWMGYGLLYESMLDSVLWARDRYLLGRDAGGLMVPSRAALRIAPLVDSDVRIEQVDFWRDVYGFDMSCMVDNNSNRNGGDDDGEEKLDEALVLTLPKSDIPNSTTTFLDLDLYTIQPSDLAQKNPFRMPLRSQKSDSDSDSQSKSQSHDGWLLYFDISFSPTHTFSTGPHAPQTHWQQLVLLTRRQDFSWREGEVVTGAVRYRKKGWHAEGGRRGRAGPRGDEDEDEERKGRSLDIEIVWGREGEGEGDEEVKDEDEHGQGKVQSQVWSLD